VKLVIAGHSGKNNNFPIDPVSRKFKSRVVVR
jgi:hypothetical protein